MNVTLTLKEWEALVSFARAGSTSTEQTRQIDAYLRTVENRNNIKRYYLVVQWKEAGYPLPPTAKFPSPWPPELRFTLERTDRPIARADVEKVLSIKAKKPVTVLVTTDPGGELGWQPIDTYFQG